MSLDFLQDAARRAAKAIDGVIRGMNVPEKGEQEKWRSVTYRIPVDEWPPNDKTFTGVENMITTLCSDLHARGRPNFFITFMSELRTNASQPVTWITCHGEVCVKASMKAGVWTDKGNPVSGLELTLEWKGQ